MKPKEKAKELVEKMRLKMPPTIIPTASTKTNQLSCDIDLKGNTKNAKQCALIAVELALEYCNGKDMNEEFDKILYLIEVKQEIELL